MKKTERKMYSENRKTYLSFSRKLFLGVYDEKGNNISEVTDFRGDMYMLNIKKEKYLLRVYLKKGYAEMFAFSDSSIKLANPITYKIPIQKSNMCFDFLEWLDGQMSLESHSNSDKKDINS